MSLQSLIVVVLAACLMQATMAFQLAPRRLVSPRSRLSMVEKPQIDSNSAVNWAEMAGKVFGFAELEECVTHYFIRHEKTGRNCVTIRK